MSKPAFSYEEFKRLCEEMQQSGQIITQRNILKQLGGSFSTISDFLARWKSETAKSSPHSYVSENLLKFLEMELSTTVSIATNRLKQDLESERKLLKDATEEIKRLEELVSNQATEIEQLKFDSTKRIDRLEIELQVAREHSEAIVKDLQVELKEMQTGVLEAKISEARLQGRLDELLSSHGNSSH